MSLVFDIGNSLCKAAFFDTENKLESKYSNILDINFIKKLSEKYPYEKKCFSTVKNLPNEILDFFESYNIVNISYFPKIPIKIKYETPSTLGQDRIAAVCGAKYFTRNQKSILVVQMGTAFTFDIINDNNEYIGGAISPGINLRFKSLHNFTDKLPLMEKTNNFDFIGKNTNSSIINGIMNGCVAEINNYIDLFRSNYQNGEVFITGGDATYFVNCAKSNIFAVENLVLYGLNFILNSNS